MLPRRRTRQRLRQATAAGVSIAICFGAAPYSMGYALADALSLLDTADGMAVPSQNIPAGPPMAVKAVSHKSRKKRKSKAHHKRTNHRHKQLQNPVLFGADDLNYDERLGLIVARGNVELNEKANTLLADSVTYDEQTDTVTATGHAALIRENGDVIFGNFLELTNQMRNGFIKDVRMLLADRSRVAGNTARRTNGDRLEIRRGVYSPCDLCTTDPTKPPLWQLRAGTLIHNSAQKLVEYRDVTLDLFGVPILYTPYLSHPDPSVKRASGFLAPTFGSSTNLGVHATIPYYWVTGPDSDVTFSPMFTGDAGTVLAGEYRQRFAFGNVDLRGSITDASVAYTSNDSVSGTNQIRGALFADGVFDLDEQFRAGFNIARESDQTYLSVYNFTQNVSYLPSHVYLEDFDGRNYGSVDTWAFQPLVEGQSSRTQPWVAPVINYNWNFRPMDWGGRFTANANASDIFRESGASARRFSVGGEFDYPFRTANGQLLNLVAGLRGDAYYVSDQPINGRIFNGTTQRAFPQVGMEWRYPFVRYGKSTFTVEPIAAVYAAPNHLNSAKIPNDDSAAFEFSDQYLFKRDRLTGYDQVDEGQRVDYGIQASWLGESGVHADALFGQSYRFEKATIFQAGTGADQQLSDYVGRFHFKPASFIDLNYRFRYDERDFTAERQEVSGNLTFSRFNMGLSYTYLAPNPRDELTEVQQIYASIMVKLNDFWSITAGGVHGLTGETANLSNLVGLQYSDECLTFQTSFQQTGTHNRDLRAGTSILFSLVFKNLGEIGLPSLRPFSSTQTS